jgi:L-asparagine transporter-like permease
MVVMSKRKPSYSIALGAICLVVAIIVYAIITFQEIESSLKNWGMLSIVMLIVLGIAFLGFWLLTRNRRNGL